jgi:hypothetical protein
MKKLVIVDLNKDNFNHLEEDCYYININVGKIRLNKGKQILFKTLKKYKVKSRESLSKELKKKLTEINDIFYQQLEIFNLRNDKIFLISKLINFLIINLLIKDKDFDDIKIITDNRSSIKIIKSFNKNISIISYDNKRLKLNLTFIKLFKFYLKTFFIVSFIKIFPTFKFKIKKELAMTIYPNYFSKENENFYKNKDLTLINFLLTDESHLGHSFFKIIKIYLKLRNKNILVAEKFVNYQDILRATSNSISRLIYLKKNNNNFFIDKINFTDFYTDYLYSSLVNRCKLDIYNLAIPKILKRSNIQTFHMYLFEYNFGFFLINLVKKINVYIKGYQHGIFSTKLFWYDIILKFNHNKFIPNEIISSNDYSFREYKALLKKRTKISLINKNKSDLLNNFKFKKKSGIKNILILPGTHDIKDFYSFVKDEIRLNKKNKYYFKLHPKNKFFFKIEKNLKIINNLNTMTFNKVMVSSTSTLVYDFNKINIPFEIFRPDYKLECY